MRIKFTLTEEATKMMRSETSPIRFEMKNGFWYGVDMTTGK